MCCFSVGSPGWWLQRLTTPRIHVSKTNIFARMIAPGVQALAYGMNLSSAREVAMILPLPVVPGSGEDAVKFVSLEEHPRMFEELQAMFIDLHAVSRKSRGMPQSIPKLVVHEIGSFIASYVPRRADFTRLDERFRLPEVLFDAVPRYADYGFAVFQLAPGKHTIHPMALTFPTRDPDRLFFPTVHVHDGRYRAKADFDHALYFQRPSSAAPDEQSSLKPSKSYADLVVVDHLLARRTLRAKLPNEDIWIAAT